MRAKKRTAVHPNESGPGSPVLQSASLRGKRNKSNLLPIRHPLQTRASFLRTKATLVKQRTMISTGLKGCLSLLSLRWRPTLIVRLFLCTTALQFRPKPKAMYSLHEAQLISFCTPRAMVQNGLASSLSLLHPQHPSNSPGLCGLY